ncbi:MAG: hypothetical protein ABWW69_01150 [Pyrodictiaceae archaeon]
MSILEEHGISITKRRIVVGLVLFLVLAILVYLGLLFILGAQAPATPYASLAIASYAASVLAAELVRGLRLTILYKWVTSSRDPVSLRLYARALLARFSGNIVSALTPSALGGEVIRGLVVSEGLRGIPRFIALGLLDGLYDLYANTILAILLIGYVGATPMSIIVLLLGLAASASWLLVSLVFSGKWARPSRLVRRLPLVGSKLVRDASKILVKGFTPGVLGPASTLTVVSWLVMAAGMLPVVNLSCSHSIDYPHTLAILLYTYLAGIIPLPAGLGSMDSWLAFTTCPSAALVWRTGVLAALGIMALASLPLVLGRLKLLLE